MRIAPVSVFGIMIACAMALSGCESFENALDSLSNDYGKHTQAAKPAPPAPADEVATRTPPTPKLKPPVPLRRAVPPAHYDPKELVGKDRAQLMSTLGAPHGVREAPPATVWNYAANGCSLDVFLYMDIATREFHALAYEVKKGEAPGNDDMAARCVGEIRAAYEAKAKASADVN